MLPAAPFAGPTVTRRLPVAHAGGCAATGWAGVAPVGEAGGEAGAGEAATVGEVLAGGTSGGRRLGLGGPCPAGWPPAEGWPPVVQALIRPAMANPAAAQTATVRTWTARERATDIGVTFSAGAAAAPLRPHRGLPGAGPYWL